MDFGGKVPQKMVLSGESQILLQSEQQLHLADVSPLVSLMKPIQHMFSDVPKLLLALEFIDKRIERMR